MTTKTDPPPGPYTSTTTKTVKLSGPIEFTTTTKIESTHVPPARGCGGGSGLDINGLLGLIAQAIPGFGGAPAPTVSDDGHD